MDIEIDDETLDGELPESRNDNNTTPLECASMRLLARDGWTSGVLKMTFHLSRAESVRKHVTGQCKHEHGVPPVRDW